MQHDEFEPSDASDEDGGLIAMSHSDWLRWRRRSPEPVYEQSGMVVSQALDSWTTPLRRRARLWRAQRDRGIGDHYRAIFRNAQWERDHATDFEEGRCELNPAFATFLTASGLDELSLPSNAYSGAACRQFKAPPDISPRFEAFLRGADLIDLFSGASDAT